MDLIAQLGDLALATRLRRLGERLQQEVTEVYAELGFPFRARWFALLAALVRRSPQSVTELAAALGLTHTGIALVAREMEAAGLVASEGDPADGRRRLLAMTPAGEALVARLTPLWSDVRDATAELVAESGHDLLAALAAVEARLEARSMGERLRARDAARSGRSNAIVVSAKEDP
jgi:DNA-binding MarR family transcriptional regulator